MSFDEREGVDEGEGAKNGDGEDLGAGVLDCTALLNVFHPETLGGPALFCLVGSGTDRLESIGFVHVSRGSGAIDGRDTEGKTGVTGISEGTSADRESVAKGSCCGSASRFVLIGVFAKSAGSRMGLPAAEFGSSWSGVFIVGDLRVLLPGKKRLRRARHQLTIEHQSSQRTQLH